MSCTEIFLLRGGGSKGKELYSSFAEKCAELGYAVIRLELAKHPVYSAYLLNYSAEYYATTNWILAFLLRMIVFEMVGQIYNAVGIAREKFSHHATVNTQEMAIIGFSLGAQVGLKYAKQTSFIKAVVAMMGLPDWTIVFSDALYQVKQQKYRDDKRCEEIVTGCGNLLSPYIRDIRDPQKVVEDFTRYLAHVQKDNLIHEITTYPPNPLLLMAGTQDLPGVLSGNQDLFKVLLPLYVGHEDKLQIKIVDTPHQLTPAMQNEALFFLNQHFPLRGT